MKSLDRTISSFDQRALSQVLSFLYPISFLISSFRLFLSLSFFLFLVSFSFLSRLVFLSLFLSFVGVPVPCMPGVSASSCTFLLFYPCVFVCYPYVARIYPYATRMYWYVTGMYSYVISVYPYTWYVLVCSRRLLVCGRVVFQSRSFKNGILTWLDYNSSFRNLRIILSDLRFRNTF